MIDRPHVAMLALAVLLRISAVAAEPGGTGSTCQGMADDCVEGYTSLLQDSMSIIGHQRETVARQSKAHLQRAKGADEQEPEPGQGREGKGAGAGADESKPEPEIVDHKQAPPASVANRTWLQDHGSLLMMGMLAVVGAVFFYVTCVKPAFQIQEQVKATPRSARSSNLSSARSSNLGAALSWIVNNPDATEEKVARIHDRFEDDTYGLAIALMVRDLRSLAVGEGKPSLKMARIGFAVGLIFLTVGIQVSIVICTKQFVTPGQVADIRDAYDHFEDFMYDGHTYLNVNGKKRGVPGYFNAALFDKMSDDNKQAACNIPFSQLPFLMLMLLVWSITCFANIKSCFETFMSLIVFAETKEDMKDCISDWKLAILSSEAGDDENNDAVSEKSGEKDPSLAAPSVAPAANIQVITGITLPCKVFFVFCVFLPEFCATSYLLWLGCRWLTATNSFSDLLCNAVALEFTLGLKRLLYYALATERNKRDLKHTGITPPWGKEGAGWGVYFNTVYWFLFSCVWVFLYIFYLQQVLPDYHWDVHQVCDAWLTNILVASGGEVGE